MRVLMALLLLISPGLLRAADPGFPPADQRSLRQLQADAYGVPSLPTDAPRGESLLALAALGSQAAQPGEKSLDAEDYAALLALLQRYRDELLSMGMDSSELRAELSILKSRAKELQARLDALHPKDGLKIYGKLYSLFDSLQVLGPGSIPKNLLAASIVAESEGKNPGVDVDTQIGVPHLELSLEGTRGAASAYAQMDLLYPWGENQGEVGVRKVWVEFRLPVVIQAGDLDASLTPLTLWRNDEFQPFQPSMFSERYQRMEDDLLLKPNDWPLEGLRLSTDVLLFKSLTLHLQSLSALVGYSSGVSLPLTNSVIYQEAATQNNAFLMERYNTYLQGWQAALDLLDRRLTLGYQGTLFFDDSSTAPGTTGYLPMNETVQSLSAAYRSRHVLINGEAAMSSYQAPWQQGSAAALQGPLTGTALTADGTLKNEDGYLKLFGRYVSSGFHASGAQGRTVDYAYQYLGPFLTEDSQIGANGLNGLMGTEGDASGGILLSNASRLNDQLIPPGVYVLGGGPGGVWQNLLAYGPGEEIDPYGVATPNRAGVGAQATYAFFGGVLAPTGSAEDFKEIDDVTGGLSGTDTYAGFTLTRYRAGLMLDLGRLWKAVPLRVGGGLTMTNASNGQQTDNALGVLQANSMSTQTTDFSLQWNAGKPMGIQAGYRHMTVQGQDETFTFGSAGESWDIMGVGVWWRPLPAFSVDLSSTVGHTVESDPAAVENDFETPADMDSAGLSSGNLQWTENFVRADVEF